MTIPNPESRLLTINRVNSTSVCFSWPRSVRKDRHANDQIGLGGKAQFVAGDLTDPADLNNLVWQVDSIDILVNNAGFSWFRPTEDLDVATLYRLFAANVRVPYFLIAALARRLRPGAAAASSVWEAWRGKSALQAPPPTAPPKRRLRR
jgi:NAD(P)-dependent dehydrogenase (short-subunit alcohol dehydrogenase family)